MGKFLGIWLGQIVSLVGSQLTAFAVGVSIYQQTGSATHYAFAILSTVAPYFVVSPIAGILVDRSGSRLALLVSYVGAASCVVWMALLPNNAPLWQILLALAAMSSFTGIEFPAISKLTYELVPRELLDRANGLVQVGAAVAQIIGPSAGGLLLASGQLKLVLWIDAVTFIVAALVVVALCPPWAAAGASSNDSHERSLRERILYGFRFLVLHPPLLGVLLLVAVVNFNLGVLQVATAPLVLTFSDTRGLGIVVSCAGLGMLGGGIVTTAFRIGRHQTRFMIGSLALQGIFLIAVSTLRTTPLVAACAFGIVFFVPLIGGSSQTIWHRHVPVEAQGRVFAVRAMLARTLVPCANVLGGIWVDRLTPAIDDAVVGQVARGGSGGGTLLMLVGGVAISSAAVAWFHGGLSPLDDSAPGELIAAVGQDT